MTVTPRGLASRSHLLTRVYSDQNGPHANPTKRISICLGTRQLVGPTRVQMLIDDHRVLQTMDIPF